MNTLPKWKRALGCHNGATHWYRGYFRHDRVVEHLACRFWDKVEWLKDRPRVYRAWLADKLAWWVLKLRGSELFDLGYGCLGNRAAALEDDLRMEIIMVKIGHAIDSDKEEEMLSKLIELARIAKAMHVCNPPKEKL